MRLPRHWLWVLLAIAMTVLASVMVLAIIDPFADTRAAPRKPGPSLPTDKTGSLSKSPEATDEASSSPTQAPDSLPPIVVRADGEVDRPFAADKLFDAMKNAMGARGWVELRNREPLKLISTSTAPLDFLTARGTLSIRAAEGMEPVIEVALNGSKPLSRWVRP